MSGCRKAKGQDVTMPGSLAAAPSNANVGVLGRGAGALMLIIGLWVLIEVFIHWRLGRASLRWPTTMGRVLVATVTQESRSVRPYLPMIYYDYSVGGQRRDGHRVGFGLVAFAHEDEAQAFIRRYPHHASVPIYYDPLHPGISTLLPDWQGSRGQMAIGSVAAAALLALGIAFLFFIPVTSSSPSTQTPHETVGTVWPLITDLLMIGMVIALSIWMHKRQDVYNWKILTAIVAAVCAGAFAMGFVWHTIRLDWGHVLLTVVLWGLLVAMIGYLLRVRARKAPPSVSVPPASPSHAAHG